jgi:hypothetical protein
MREKLFFLLATHSLQWGERTRIAGFFTGTQHYCKILLLFLRFAVLENIKTLCLLRCQKKDCSGLIEDSNCKNCSSPIDR